MADMLAWFMSKTFAGRTGHYRTSYQTQELLSLKVIKPSDLWKECIYLAEAYQRERPRNLKKISKVSEDLRVDFETSLLRVIRASNFKPVFIAEVKSGVLDDLSASWLATSHKLVDRESLHRKVVTNPEMLSSNRVERPAVSEVDQLQTDDILNRLSNSFEDSVKGFSARERRHSQLVRDPALLSTKAGRPG